MNKVFHLLFTISLYYELYGTVITKNACSLSFSLHNPNILKMIGHPSGDRTHTWPLELSRAYQAVHCQICILEILCSQTERQEIECV